MQSCARLLLAWLILVGLVGSAYGQSRSSAPAAEAPQSEIDALYPDIEALYMDLHQSPELAFQEVQTAAKLAERLRKLGYDVSTGVGRTGIVAVLKNGTGPTAMLRTELDALPVEEKTGLPFASKVVVQNAGAPPTPVMHA